MQIENEIIVRLAVNAAKNKAGSWLALSQFLNVSRTTVYSWKYGKFYPSCDQFINILYFLGVTNDIVDIIQKAE